MAYLLQGGILLTLDPVIVERAALRIEGAQITDRASNLQPRPTDEIIDCTDMLIMPGMVCGHTHLYSALARGMPAPPRVPHDFKEILELIWWRLDRALDEETIYWSALAGAMDAARAGTTCLFDHHASPSHIGGSLQIVREAIEKVGLRAVLCYEVTDRGGRKERDQGLEENRAFLQSVRASQSTLFRGIVGAHASFTLSDDSLRACADLMHEFDTGLHIHVAEDRCDVEDAQNKYRCGVIERLSRYNALNERTILAHGTHLDDHEVAMARDAGVWFAHNPRSNMNNQVGYAPAAAFGEHLLLGTDGIGADMFEEIHFAFFKGRDARLNFGANEWLNVLGHNQRLAMNIFDMQSASPGPLSPGSVADLVVLDYQSPTPLTAENAAWHFFFGLNSTVVEDVIVNGKFTIKKKNFLIDARNLYEKARKASAKLWAKLQE